MGYGPIRGGKQHPITPWEGSWAATVNLMCCRCGGPGHLAKDCKWPLLPQQKT